MVIVRYKIRLAGFDIKSALVVKLLWDEGNSNLQYLL